MIKKNQDTFNYRVSGNGYPVLFLHGFLESMLMWNDLGLENNYLCIQIDFPGHGASLIQENEDVSMSNLALKLMAFMDSLGCKGYAIVGHSMGGYVGLELMKIDSRCSKLILLNSNFWSDSRNKVDDRKRVADIVMRNKNIFLYESIPNLFCDPESNEREVKLLINEAKEIEAKVIASYSLAMSKRNDNQEVLKSRSEEVLVIQGEFDSVVPLKETRRKISAMNCKLEIISNCAHMCHIESPKKVVEFINKFLL